MFIISVLYQFYIFLRSWKTHFLLSKAQFVFKQCFCWTILGSGSKIISIGNFCSKGKFVNYVPQSRYTFLAIDYESNYVEKVSWKS